MSPEREGQKASWRRGLPELGSGRVLSCPLLASAVDPWVVPSSPCVLPPHTRPLVPNAL